MSSVFAIRLFTTARMTRAILIFSTLTLNAMSSTTVSAYDELTLVRRGSLADFQLANDEQLLEWTGPDATQLPWPRTVPGRSTEVSLRLVPEGRTLIRKLPSLGSITRLSIVGVAMDDSDLNCVIDACHGLRELKLIHPSAIPADEQGDLTDTERCTLNARNVSDNALAKLSELNHLVSLDLGGYSLPTTRLQFLAHMPALESLALCNMTITDDDLRDLRGLNHLKSLKLSKTSVTGTGLRYLRECHSLTSIDLSHCPITDDISQFAKNAPWAQLQAVEIHATRLSTNGIAALKRTLPFTEVTDSDDGPLTPPNPCDAQSLRLHRAALRMLNRLRVADFYGIGNVVTDAVVDPISQRQDGGWVFPYLSVVKGLTTLQAKGCPLSRTALESLRKHVQLEYLNLSDSTLDDAGLKNVVSLLHLKGISLTATRVTDAGVASLANLQTLEGLDFDGTDVTDRALDALRPLPRLRSLTVRNCRIKDDGVQHLAVHTTLETIRLDGTGVTDRSIRLLVKLPRLKYLSLNNCRLSDIGLADLLDAPSLECLCLRGVSVTTSTARKLRQRIKVVDLDGRPPHKVPAQPNLSLWLRPEDLHQKRSSIAWSHSPLLLDASIISVPTKECLDVKAAKSAD
jgi:Leucine-rich repeat (LRR) protein